MKTLLVVDGNSILNRAFYGIRTLTNSAGLPTNAVYGMITMLNRQVEKYKPDYAAIAFDLPTPTFRHKMYEGYKATRKGMPEELTLQMPYAKRVAEAMGFTIIESFMDSTEIISAPGKGTTIRMSRQIGSGCLSLKDVREG